MRRPASTRSGPWPERSGGWRSARQKIEAVRHWTRVIERAVDDFLRSRSRFANWIDVDFPKATSALDQMSEALVTYITLEAGPQPETRPQPLEPRRTPTPSRTLSRSRIQSRDRRYAPEARAVKTWDLASPAGKLELALKIAANHRQRGR